jgi:hypothetical protein
MPLASKFNATKGMSQPPPIPAKSGQFSRLSGYGGLSGAPGSPNPADFSLTGKGVTK